jgi:putative ABC transport system substrate-binding protein
MQARRRILWLIALGALPILSSFAQGRVWRLGVLSIRARPISLESDVQYGSFLKGLRELGYVEGKNLVIEWRFAHAQYELLPVLASELVRLKVDVIAVVNVPVIRAAQDATRTIPIVMLSSSDPIGSGFVASLARPGGNITGLSNVTADLTSKYLDLLTALLPNASTIAFLLNPANTAQLVALKSFRTAADRLGIRTLGVKATTRQDLDTAFASAANEKAAAIIVGNDAVFFELRQSITDLRFKYRMPSIFAIRAFVDAGGLMSYGYDQSENYRHAATYVDRIFKGAKPADLPIERAATLRLIINRNAAKALGLTIPPQLLVRADEVIE